MSVLEEVSISSSPPQHNILCIFSQNREPYNKRKKVSQKRKKGLLFKALFVIISKRELSTRKFIGGGGDRNMANIKSSAKRDLKSKQLRAKNRADKTELKTMMKKFDAAVAEGNRDEAVSAYKVAVKTVDRAAGKGLLPKNNAARKKSALTVKLNGLGE